MTTKNSPSSLVSGMGTAMAFLQSLVNEIVRLGGYPEMLHPLSGEHGKAIVAQLAELIVQSPWKVPRTLIEKLVAASVPQSGAELEDICHFQWDSAIDLKGSFKIPVIGFSASHNMDSTTTPIPAKLMRQLRDMKIEYPLYVEWNNEPHIVVGYWGEKLEIGQEYPDLELEYLYLAPAKYFDLER